MTSVPNPMEELYQRLGQRVVCSESSWWHEVHPHVFQSFPYYRLIQPQEPELQALLREYRLRAIRYTTPLEGFGFFSTVELNTSTDYDISTIRKTEVRRAIRHGIHTKDEQRPALSLWRCERERYETRSSPSHRQGLMPRVPPSRTGGRSSNRRVLGRHGFEPRTSCV